VKFTQAARSLVHDGVTTFVEVGPGQRPLRADQADRPWRAHDPRQRPREPGEGAAGPVGVSGFCSLDGKLALVTGASRGIGRAIAEELGARRCERRARLPHRAGRGRGARRRESPAAPCRRTCPIPAPARALVEEAGDVDILVNNAGLTRDGLLARMSDDDWRTVIETNLSSVFYTCRAVTRPMMKKRAGAIVNVSSIVGVHGNWGQTNYAASKAGHHRLHEVARSRARQPQRARQRRRPRLT
jgi:NAD(P)-dependent dehydrogenase (short-subunit alcohol dehydrogenase family)